MLKGHWGLLKTKFLKESMNLNWNFQRRGRCLNQGEVWIFSGTTQYVFTYIFYEEFLLNVLASKVIFYIFL